MTRLAVIGAGAMGGAIVRGVLAAGLYAAEDIVVAESSPQRTVARAQELGVTPGTTEAVAAAEVVVFAVKPYAVEAVLREWRPQLHAKAVISVAAGVTLARLQAAGGESVPLVRVMPNTPVAVGAGMTAIAGGERADAEALALAETLFRTLGRVAVVEETALEALGALSGAGPGYAFVILDALADAGVRIGLPRELAIEAAAQTLFGAAKMQLESGEHPAVLRDRVTSPGGTTIAGLHAMERGGLRAALLDGVCACHARARELTQDE